VPGLKYDCYQQFVAVDAAQANKQLKIRIDGSAGTGANPPYQYYVDLVELGPKLPYPSVKVVLVNVGMDPEFLSVWQGTGDPIPGLDYELASYLGLSYIAGLGGLYTLEYYRALLQIVKPFGVRSTVEVIGRSV
jgi:hypothetical protein